MRVSKGLRLNSSRLMPHLADKKTPHLMLSPLKALVGTISGLVLHQLFLWVMLAIMIWLHRVTFSSHSNWWASLFFTRIQIIQHACVIHLVRLASPSFLVLFTCMSDVCNVMNNCSKIKAKLYWFLFLSHYITGFTFSFLQENMDS